MGIDISECFHNFQLAVKGMLDYGPKKLTLEEHTQNILALSSILLLKPGRTHPDLHQHIDYDTCDQLLDHILRSHVKTQGHVFPDGIKNSVEKIVKCIVDSEPLNLPAYTGNYTRMFASHEITTLLEGATLSPANRILLAIRNMVECLPRHMVGDGPLETELVTRHLQSVLLPLFEDMDAGIVLRWTSVSDDEKMITTRPDASMNFVRGASLGHRVGCGEVKPQYQALNHNAIAKDLIRVCHMAKDASDKNQARVTFAFLAVGNHGTFYILQRAQEHLYLMCEIEHVQLPMVLAEIPIFFKINEEVQKIHGYRRYTEPGIVQ
ncbi:hypothetical protein DM01DRAFT_1323629 [Hesseltinella vesiculosa]|uniref:Uncharacterized protein n=1 Tax=Hesseltinella vesiculosa TaxID=101127 RepID=A0A1X2GFD1_9FUNG|nr:hypothetical protein DM01DRAFT_1323629 [Hesseltinella vesiculosa]